MLLATGTTINIQSGIGCIMLGGIVVNNAILLVDHTNLLRRRDGMAVTGGRAGGNRGGNSENVHGHPLRVRPPACLTGR